MKLVAKRVGVGQSIYFPQVNLPIKYKGKK
jgi:hypothetical protein